MHVLVVADSLAFYGPDQGELSTDPRLYPNVLAASLSALAGQPVHADLVARTGWTARDAWWALTRDPHVYSVLLPRASAVVLAVGNMDYMPTLVPTWLREGIRFLRPPLVRRSVRWAYRAAQPLGSLVTPWRALPQRLTDRYLSNCVGGVRYYQPGVPVVGIVPPPHAAPSYGRRPRGHARAMAAARAWGARENVPMADLDPLVRPHLDAGRSNPDGMHFAWETHEAIGSELAAVVGEALGLLPGGGTGVGALASNGS
jgi:hypothetical protein